MNPGRCLPKYRVEISSAPLQCHLSCFASKIDGIQNITLASLEPKNQCLMSYAGYVHGQSSSNISPRKLDQTRKAPCFRGRGSNSCQVLYRRPKVYLSSRSFQPIWNFRWKKQTAKLKGVLSFEARVQGTMGIKSKTHRIIYTHDSWKYTYGQSKWLVVSPVLQRLRKKTMISVNNLRNKFLLAGSPGLPRV